MSDKKKKSGIFWVRVFGLAILVSGLLARNTIVILIALVFLAIIWASKRKKIGKKRAFGKKDKKQNSKEAGILKSQTKSRAKISGPVSVKSDPPAGEAGPSADEASDSDIYNLDEELKRWK